MKFKEAPRTYSEKLKDPRWQKKRLEVFNRDGFACRRCGETDREIHVHHLVYESGQEPWDYADALLVTLCKECHEEIEGVIKDLRLHIVKDHRACMALARVIKRRQGNGIPHLLAAAAASSAMYESLSDVGLCIYNDDVKAKDLHDLVVRWCEESGGFYPETWAFSI